MRLVPRQLQIHGLTGDVPYYGGRLTPAQAYAATHRRPAGAGPPGVPPPGLAPVGGAGSAIPPVSPPGGAPPPGPPVAPTAVPQAAALNVPSTLQPRNVAGLLAPATPSPGRGPAGQVPGALLGTQAPPGGAAAAPVVPAARPAPAAERRPESQRAIQQLLLAGIITPAEASELAGRLDR